MFIQNLFSANLRSFAGHRPNHSQLMLSQVLDKIAGICLAHGITTVFQCPGSRNAPLTLAFERAINTTQYTVPDERVAAYMALGHGLVSGKASIVHTTSGTAAFNLAPAVAEAYFAKIPLLVFTADRPAEWLGQQDGQMINQQHIYGSHVKAFYQMPAQVLHSDDLWAYQNIINEAILEAHTYPHGPVHINFPFREPFYPAEDYDLGHEPIDFAYINEIKTKPSLDKHTLHNLVNTWLTTEKKLILVGQMPYNLDLRNALSALHYYTDTPILAEVTSNLNGIAEVITEHDLFLKSLTASEKEALQPELLITIGGPILSKSVKQFLRAYPAKAHWHIQESGKVANPLQSLSTIIRSDETHFITKLGEASFFAQAEKDTNQWLSIAYSWREKVQHFNAPFGDFQAIDSVLSHLPEECVIHIGNSMPIRYANLLTHRLSNHQQVFANRGTSGIDGSTSTAIGAALAWPDKKHYLISGDVSFQYDSNALWVETLPDNLIIVIINNSGGNIFRLIDGPRKFKAMKQRFETVQNFTAQGIADEAIIPYYAIQDAEGLAELLLTNILNTSQTCIIEIFTNPDSNQSIYQAINNL